MSAIIATERKLYHESLLSEGVLTIDPDGIPSNADRASKLSIAIAQSIARQLTANIQDKIEGQKSGAKFEQINMLFIQNTFTKMCNLRPGKWHVVKLGNNSLIKTSCFAQYEHLDYLVKLAEENRKLAANIGNDYMIGPDIVVYREPEPDSEINFQFQFVDESTAMLADLRQENGGLPILHASISVKWTLRSDRAQSSRAEALNLIRNRKGRLPHIVAVTGEPMPSRIASLAMGTGDIDCVYHFALPELIQAVRELKAEDAAETLHVLLEGKRLKDISDLPLDLAV